MSKQLDSTGLKRLHRDWRRRSTGRLALILDNVQGPFNVGAITRTAAAYRVDHVWLVGATPSLGASNVQKTALGTDRFLSTTSCERAVDAIAEAKAQGYRVVALELAVGAVPLHDLERADATCVVVGHEDHGVGAAALAAADRVAFLPQLGRVGSLNVATAASIAMYEIRRGEWEGTDG